MTKVDRFLDSLASDPQLANASFMGLGFPMLIATLRSMAPPEQLENLINQAVAKWEAA